MARLSDELRERIEDLLQEARDLTQEEDQNFDASQIEDDPTDQQEELYSLNYTESTKHATQVIDACRNLLANPPADEDRIAEKLDELEVLLSTAMREEG